MDVLPDFSTLDDEELEADRRVRARGGGALLPAPAAARPDRHPARRAGRPDQAPPRRRRLTLAVDIDRLTDILAHKGPPPGGRVRRGSGTPCTAPSADITTGRSPGSAAGAAPACSRPSRVRRRIELQPRRGERRRHRRDGRGRGGADAGHPPRRGPLRRPVLRRPATRRRSAARPIATCSWTTSPCRATTPCWSAAGRDLPSRPGQPERHLRQPRAGRATRLADGDELQIGKYRLTFIDANDMSAEPHPVRPRQR